MIKAKWYTVLHLHAAFPLDKRARIYGPLYIAGSTFWQISKQILIQNFNTSNSVQLSRLTLSQGRRSTSTKSLINSGIASDGCVSFNCIAT